MGVGILGLFKLLGDQPMIFSVLSSFCIVFLKRFTNTLFDSILSSITLHWSLILTFFMLPSIRCLEIPSKGEIFVRNPLKKTEFLTHASASISSSQSTLPDLPRMYISFIVSCSAESTSINSDSPKNKQKVIAVSSGVCLEENETYFRPIEECPFKVLNIMEDQEIYIRFSIHCPNCSGSMWLLKVKETVLNQFNFIVSASSPFLDIIFPIFSQLSNWQGVGSRNCSYPISQRARSSIYGSRIKSFSHQNDRQNILILGDETENLHEIARSLINLSCENGYSHCHLVDLDQSYSGSWCLQNSQRRAGCSLDFYNHCISAYSIDGSSQNRTDVCSEKMEIHLYCDSGDKNNRFSSYDHSTHHLSRLLKNRRKNFAKKKRKLSGHEDILIENSYIIFPFHLSQVLEDSIMRDKDTFSFDHQDVDSYQKRLCAIMKWFEITTVIFAGSDEALETFLSSLHRYFPMPSPMETPLNDCVEKKPIHYPFSFSIGSRSVNIFHAMSFSKNEHELELHTHQNDTPFAKILNRPVCFEYDVSKRKFLDIYAYQSLSASTCSNMARSDLPLSLRTYFFGMYTSSEIVGKADHCHSCAMYQVNLSEISTMFVEPHSIEGSHGDYSVNEFKSFVLPIIDHSSSTKSEAQVKRDFPTITFSSCKKLENSEVHGMVFAIFRRNLSRTEDGIEETQNEYNDIAGWGMLIAPPSRPEVFFLSPLEPPLFDGRFFFLLVGNSS